MAEGTKDEGTSNAMWGGRFASGPAAIMEEINASIGFDKKLYAQDIRGSIAHATMLAHQGIISDEDKIKIIDGLNTILSEIEEGRFEFSRKLEDIHMNVEARLATLIGPAAGRLHTARSRNDQVALDFRLWVKEELQKVETALTALIGAFLTRAEEHADTVMPASPICRRRSRSPSATIAWPMWKCSAAIAPACAMPSSIWTKARSAQPHSPARPIRSTAT